MLRRLALSVAALLCLAVASASASASAQTTAANTGTQACAFEGEHIRHRGAKYLVGRPHKRGSIYAACENGHLTCFEDNGIADAPQLKHLEVPCDVRAVREQQRKLGVAVRLKEDVWPNGLVWYRISANFSASERTMIDDAIAVYASTDVKITFKACEPVSLCQNKYVSFEQNEDACYSYVGYVDDGHPQIVNLGESCFDGLGTVVHEVGHALGLYHEHTHPQREVIILTDADLPVSAANYAKETDAILKPYDRGSIMHYGRSAGLCLPKDKYPLKSFCDVEVTTNCVMPVRQHCNTTRSREIGQRAELSAGDLNTLKVLYGATDGTNSTSKPVPIPDTAGANATNETTTTAPTSKPPTPTTVVPTTAPVPTTAAPSSTPASVSPSVLPTPTRLPAADDSSVATEVPTATPADATTTPAIDASSSDDNDAPYPVTTSVAPVTTQTPATTTATPVQTQAPASPSYPYVPGDVHGEGHFAGMSNGIWWAVEWLKHAKKAATAKWSSKQTKHSDGGNDSNGLSFRGAGY